MAAGAIRREQAIWIVVNDGHAGSGSHRVAVGCKPMYSPREVSEVELSGMVASLAHLAYHLGAIRQIDRQARGPKVGTF